MKLTLCTFGMGTLDVYHTDTILSIDDMHSIQKTSYLYIPLKFSHNVHPDVVKNACNFILHIKKIPVVIFPELYAYLTIPTIIKLHKKGALFIADAMSLIGIHGDLNKSKALYLIRHGLSCCIGFVNDSDVSNRYYQSLFGVCKRKLKDCVERPIYLSLFEKNPQALLANKPIASKEGRSTDFIMPKPSRLRRISQFLSGLWNNIFF